jgi:hypothetical protein
MFKLNIRVTTLEIEKKEACEALAKEHKRNLHLETQLTHDKTNQERLLKEIEKKIKQLTPTTCEITDSRGDSYERTRDGYRSYKDKEGRILKHR